jgi:uncharacterized membrane protein YeiB
MPLLSQPGAMTAAPPLGPVAHRAPEARRIRRPGRVTGLDVARALAVFGMLGAHFGAVAADVDFPPSSWLGVVNGRSSILFATLAGVSIALLSGRTVVPAGVDLVRARTRILVRAAWVFAIGVTLEALDTQINVILGVYGLLFVLALPFLRWPPRRLLIAAGLLAVLAPPAQLLFAVAAQAAGLDQSPPVQLAVTGPYPALVWWTFILVGMAVGRSDLGSPRVQARLLAAGATLAALGYGAGWLTTRWWGQAVTAQGWFDGPVPPRTLSLTWLSGAAPHSGTTFEVLGSVGVALVVIAGCLGVAERLRTLTFPLEAVGSMALTAYAGSIVAAAGVIDADTGSNWTWLAIVTVTVVLVTGWRLTLGQGPLERLLSWSSGKAATWTVRYLASRRRPDCGRRLPGCPPSSTGPAPAGPQHLAALLPTHGDADDGLGNDHRHRGVSSANTAMTTMVEPNAT